MQAGFAAYFYESVAGIRPRTEDPGFKNFIIKPAFPGDLEYAVAEIQSPYGKIASNWSRKENAVKLQLEVPFNTEAHVIPPLRNGSSLILRREDGVTTTSENV